MIRLSLLGLFLTLAALAQEGSQTFISQCLRCHSPTSTTHASSPEALAQIPWQDVLKTLDAGVMKVQAQALSEDERIAVARFVGKDVGTQVLPEVTGFCKAVVKPEPGKASWNGWGADERNTRFQPPVSAGMSAADVLGLKAKWVFGYRCWPGI